MTTRNPGPQILLIDALNLIRRIHAAVPENDAQALQERCRGALNKALRLHQPSHAILVWDGGHQHSWRRKLYPEYKAHRKPMPDDLARQLPQLRQQAKALGIRSVHIPDFEADDLIATLACKVAQHHGQVLILSTDKGFAQLHNQYVRQWDHFQGQPIDEALLHQKTGVPPSRLLDYWSLAGDSGNGIPGVPGIGKKTATDLIQRFETLKAMFEPEAVEGKLGEKLRQNQQAARLSYQLVRLRQDLELALNLNQFRLKDPV